MWYKRVNQDTYQEVHSHDDLHPECTDIVYCITYTTGQQYIGKKTVRSMSTVPVLKTKVREGSEVVTRHVLRDEEGKIITSKKERAKARKRGLKAKAEKYEVVMTDKPFINYKGSSELTKELTVLRKDIIYQCSTKKAATYLEAMLLFETDAVFVPEYLNANISGTFFDNDLKGLINE